MAHDREQTFTGWMQRLRTWHETHGLPRPGLTVSKSCSNEEKRLSGWLSRMQQLHKADKLPKHWQSQLSEIPDMKERICEWCFNLPIDEALRLPVGADDYTQAYDADKHIKVRPPPKPEKPAAASASLPRLSWPPTRPSPASVNQQETAEATEPSAACNVPLADLATLAEKLVEEALRVQNLVDALRKLGQVDVRTSIRRSLHESKWEACRASLVVVSDVAIKAGFLLEPSQGVLASSSSSPSLQADGPRSRKRPRMNDASGSPPEWALEQILSNLRKMRFKRQERFNVIRKRDRSLLPHGCNFGLRWDYRGTCGISKRSFANKRCTALFKLLCDFARRFRPDFKFTSIQVNRNVATVLHVDKNNAGLSLAITLGKHTDGELYIHGIGKVQVYNVFYVFDGNIPHLTCPFEGERYCLVFFSTVGFENAPQRDKQRLLDIGVPLPEGPLQMKEHPSARNRLEEARSSLPPDLCKCVPVDGQVDEKDSDSYSEEEGQDDEGGGGEVIVIEEDVTDSGDSEFRHALQAGNDNDEELDKVLRMSLEDFEDAWQVAIKQVREITNCCEEQAVAALNGSNGNVGLAVGRLLEPAVTSVINL